MQVSGVVEAEGRRLAALMSLLLKYQIYAGGQRRYEELECMGLIQVVVDQLDVTWQRWNRKGQWVGKLMEGSPGSADISE